MPTMKTAKTVVSSNTDIFDTAFSSGPPAQFDPLKIGLAPKTTPVRVHLRIHMQNQFHFKSRTVEKLVSYVMV